MSKQKTLVITKSKKASVLVVSLIIMGVILITALSFSLSSIRERRTAVNATRSNIAYQNAETGVEKVMDAIINEDYSTVGQLCSSGVLSGTGYSIQLIKDDDVISDPCGTSASLNLSEVSAIKSVGSDANTQEQRAIEAAITITGP